MKKEIIIYQTKNGSLELKGDFKQETIWANQTQIVDLFNVDQSVISRHIKNIFKDGELEEKSNMQKMHIANSDKPVIFYSLDVVLAVGYKTNSKIAIEFRKWATKTLHNHITKGYTFNKKILAKNYANFLHAVEDVKKLLPTNSQFQTKDALELIKLFAGTWFSLDAYDKSALPKSGLSKKQVDFTAKELSQVLAQLKQDLQKKKEASNLFGQEKQTGSLDGIVGNVFHSLLFYRIKVALQNGNGEKNDTIVINKMQQ
ncbi:MAG: RhuM family protein [Patescibacteria group bacterium]